MKNRKIAYTRTHFSFNLKSGGSVGHTLGVLNGFIQDNYQVKVVSNEKFLGIDDFNYFIVKPKNILPFLREFFYNFYARNKFKKEILKIKPDFIYHRYTGYTFFVAKIANELRIPLVLEFNSFDTWKIKYWENNKNTFKRFIKRYLLFYLIKKIENFNLKKASLITTVSQPLKEDLLKLGIPEGKILVNPNGVNLKKFDPEIENSIESKELRQKLDINNNELIVGFSGTFGPWHGIPQLTEAIDIILGEKLINHIHFLLIGDGILRYEMIKKLKKYRNVIFTGTIPYSKIQNYLAICDILVSPHCPQVDGREFFGSPTKLFEYMAMKKGIVASNLGQIGEILKDKQTAILVKPGDVRDLVKGIKFLSGSSELRKYLGENARKEGIKKYTWGKHIERIMEKLDLMIK